MKQLELRFSVLQNGKRAYDYGVGFDLMAKWTDSATLSMNLIESVGGDLWPYVIAESVWSYAVFDSNWLELQYAMLQDLGHDVPQDSYEATVP